MSGWVALNHARKSSGDAACVSAARMSSSQPSALLLVRVRHRLVHVLRSRAPGGDAVAPGVGVAVTEPIKGDAGLDERGLEPFPHRAELVTVLEHEDMATAAALQVETFVS